MAQYVFGSKKGERIIVYDNVQPNDCDTINLKEIVIAATGEGASQYNITDQNVKEVHFEMQLNINDANLLSTSCFKIFDGVLESKNLAADISIIKTKVNGENIMTLKLDYDSSKNKDNNVEILNILDSCLLESNITSPYEDLAFTYHNERPSFARYIKDELNVYLPHQKSDADMQANKATIECNIPIYGHAPQSVRLANCELKINDTKYENLKFQALPAKELFAAEPNLHIQTSLQVIGQDDSKLEDSKDILLYTCHEQLSRPEIAYEFLKSPESEDIL